MNGIATITIDGQIVRLKFGLPAVRRIFEKMSEHELVVKRNGKDQYNDLGIAHILFAGYLNGCMQRDEQPALSFESFYDVVENFAAGDHDREEIIAAVKSFEESRFVKPLADKGEKEEDEQAKKKKLNGTK